MTRIRTNQTQTSFTGISNTSFRQLFTVYYENFRAVSFRIINYPMPDLKKVEKKTWMKIGAASTALLVTGVGVAFGAAYDWGQ